ncbi:MAG: T9SS type A sorting domain-containing protein [Candidatus Marinimicrobia bacterium]|nr:T9SS type A sorting domain-containing protein [Candidatus Neomarinimicrobiota bacterium]MCF7904788.1 T9SS type A sorting domain-containing protein [Candidatus Neomarinimicrobiota bacterium]
MQRLIISLITLFWSTHIQAQSVIINEVSQGSGGGKEWVEFLVVDSGVDLRGWELGDNDDGTWHSICEFTTHPKWSEVAQGTIIVIYNDGDVDETITAAGGEDTVITDKSVIIPVGNSDFITDTGLWGGTTGAFANSDGDDGPAIRDASDTMIHDLAVTHPTASVSAPGSGQVKYFTGNNVDDLSNEAYWTEVSSSNGTPGEGNGGDNSKWIDTSLPVELSHWQATSVSGGILLQWRTESETENQGFVILRSMDDGRYPQEIASFADHAQLAGQGSTSERNEYEYLDTEVEVGQVYHYQLMDVDYANQSTLHPLIEITYVGSPPQHQASAIQLDSIFPNPANPGFTIALTLASEGVEGRLDIYNVKGALVKHLNVGALTSGENLITWNGRDASGHPVDSGVYVVRLVTEDQVQHRLVTLVR